MIRRIVLHMLLLLTLSTGSAFAVITDYQVFPTTFNWIEISGTGTSTGVYGDDFAVTVPLGFNFTYYGNTYSSVGIGSNGILTFGGASSSYSNFCLPSTSGPTNVIAPFWDDLYVVNGKGNIYYATIGTAPNRKFVVQYNNVDYCCVSTGNLTFEVILSEADETIIFQYMSMLSADASRGSGNSATIGIENASGTVATLYSCNSSTITNGTALQFGESDTDHDGLPNWFEILYGTNPNDPNDPVLTEDVDGDGLNWLQEFQHGTNPRNPDTDSDGVNDGTEVAIGTNPAVSDGPVNLVTVIPGTAFGTVYFKFTVDDEEMAQPDKICTTLITTPKAQLPAAPQGYRVYYGAQHGEQYSDYDAHFDITNPNNREGIIDQRWGMKGVPEVYFRITPYVVIDGQLFIGPLSNEFSSYFSGTKFVTDPANNSSATTTVTSNGGSSKCFIATAAYGSPFVEPVTWLREFRDSYLLTNAPGRWFVDTYYHLSPPLADYIAAHAWLKPIARVLLLPFVAVSFIMVRASLLVQIALAILMVAAIWRRRVILARRVEVREQ